METLSHDPMSVEHILYDRSNTSARCFTFYSDRHGKVVMENVYWWRWLGCDLDHIDAVDPSGGPMIWIGMDVGQHKITSITQIKEDAALSRLVVSFLWTAHTFINQGCTLCQLNNVTPCL
jgi:hypothetical protein